MCEFDVNRLFFNVFGMIMLFFVRFSQLDVNRLLFDVFGMIMLFFVRFGHNQLLKDISRQSLLQFVLSGSVPVFFFVFVREDGVLERRIWVYLKRNRFSVYQLRPPLSTRLAIRIDNMRRIKRILDFITGTRRLCGPVRQTNSYQIRK